MRKQWRTARKDTVGILQQTSGNGSSMCPAQLSRAQHALLPLETSSASSAMRHGRFRQQAYMFYLAAAVAFCMRCVGFTPGLRLFIMFTHFRRCTKPPDVAYLLEERNLNRRCKRPKRSTVTWPRACALRIAKQLFLKN